MGVPFKQIIVLDFESRYSSKPQDWCPDAYTLRKMTTEEYVRSKLFKAFGCSIREFKRDAVPTQWYQHRELPRIFGCYDWAKTAVVAHNAQFDVSILSWIYGIQPAFIFDTLSMSRALRGVKGKNSLADLARDFRLPSKGEEIALSDGLYELPPDVERKLGKYCNHDVFLCEEILKRFLLMCRGSEDLDAADNAGTEFADFDDAYDMASWSYPIKELRLIDMTLRMYTRPLLELDQDMLQDALFEEKEKREGLLGRLGVTDGDLASNDRFASLLETMGVEPPLKKKRATPKTPHPKGFLYAFAKNDAMFQAMLNGDNEDVAMLCEARLKVKSTTERTRAQRFLDISSRGTLPVPLHYYGAITGRWAAAKGSAINMQNLKRGSFLRKSIMAPEDHEIVVVDLSQIEPRVLAWLSDYTELLDIFRSGKDAYATFGATMFNMPGLNKDDHPDLRQSAKSALLGCFGEDTLVLTQRGWVPIVQVRGTDTLWDGEEWVNHQGVLAQGEKEVLTAFGISATSDHEILTGHGWAEWSAVLADRSLLQSALWSANSPVSPGSGGATPTEPAASSHACVAVADGKASCTEATSSAGAQRGAIDVPNERPSKPDGSKKATLPSAPSETIASASSTGSAPSSPAAQTQRAASTLTTAGAGSPCTPPGSPTEQSSSSTSSGSKDGTPPSCSSIDATTPGATSPGTCASSHAASTWPTNAASPCAKSSSCEDVSPPLKQRMQTFDIAYAGPRNRYTVWTEAGPLIAHNCGYQLGWASFAGQLLVGFLGAPPVRYDKAFAKKLGVNGAFIEDFIHYRDGENVTKMMEIAHTCTTEQLLIHCVAAKKIIDIYRATAYPVTGFWAMCGELIESALFEGHEHVYKCLTFRKEEILLPNGMSLRYPDLRREKDEEGQWNWVYGDTATKLYPGKVTNNVTQGLARIVMTDGLLRVSARMPLVGTVHDEGLGIVKEGEGKPALAWMIRRMTEEPKYMPGIPLAAEGGHHRRYGLAKK